MIKHNCKTKIREFNLRATPARTAVMRLLEKTKEPVDVNAIINYLKKENIKTDPCTVFRIMNIFTKKGITVQVQLEEGKARYELKSLGDHHHLICERCEKIEDISDCVIPIMESKIRKKKHFLVKRHSLEFYGLCSNCR